MTVVVVAASPDGIALASDSRRVQTEGPHHRISSDASQKVFSIAGRFGVATYGIAMIGPKTIAGLMAEWQGELSEDQPATLAECATKLGDFFHDRLSDATPVRRGKEFPDFSWPLGFLVVGYGDDGIGAVYDVRVRSGDAKATELDDVSTVKPGVLSRGQTDVIRRMIRGVDHAGLEKIGLADLDQLRPKLDPLAYDLIPPQTTQDAVNFAYFLVRVTAEMQRFTDGTFYSKQSIPGCGGPTQALVMSPAGAQWIHELATTRPADTL